MTKTVLITGASGGIGLELSKIFADRGYDLIVTARSEKKLEQLKAELEKKYGINVFVIVKDLAQKDAAKDIFETVEQAGLSVHILVNNAGFGDYGRYAESDWEKQFEMVQVNITALIQLTRLFLPQMIRRKDGKILIIASVAAFAPGPYMSVYYASKAFVLSFSEALTSELKGSGVTVTAVCPGPTKSGFEKAAGAETAKVFRFFKNADSADVALFSYRALKSRKSVAVYGFQNKLMAFGTRLFPKRIIRWFVSKLQGVN